MFKWQSTENDSNSWTALDSIFPIWNKYKSVAFGINNFVDSSKTSEKKIYILVYGGERLYGKRKSASKNRWFYENATFGMSAAI